MSEKVLIELASIILLGIGAQWLAWRLRFPSILLLLLFGFIAGPVSGFLDPNRLLGELLLPVVSVSVAVILFEGGLSLSLVDLPEIKRVFWSLITLGVLVTWVIAAAAGYFVLDMDAALAVLLGAILVVSGPTVIMPLLRHVRPIGQVGSILRWEGIVVDPIGAMLAVIVFEVITLGGVQSSASLAAGRILRTLVIGGGVGFLSAKLLTLLLKWYWIPDFLQNAVSLMMVIVAFTASNLLEGESGLLTVTVMGVVVANQKVVSVKHIIEFKENLSVLLLSSLFILLAARLQVSQLTVFGAGEIAFLGVLMLVGRPLAVMLSTVGSSLDWRERIFLSWMAPRGIVAAAIASVFALRLTEAGYPGAERLVPLTFLVIVSTVVVYGLTVLPLSRWLQVAEPNPQGFLIVGAHSWARALAGILHKEGYRVLLVDTNRDNLSAARMTGLPTFHASILSEDIMDEIELGGIGRLLALTSNDEINSLAALHFAEVFGRSEVYQLPMESNGNGRRESVSQHLRGRFLFGPEIKYPYLASRFASGAVIKKTALTEEFDYDAFKDLYGEDAIPLFLIPEKGNITILTADQPVTPRPGQILISMVNPAKGISAETVKQLSVDEKTGK